MATVRNNTLRILPFGAEQFVPRVPVDAEILGVVQRGQLIGALVRWTDGSYVQVNGDVVQKLNSSAVEHALRKAGGGRRRPGKSSPKPAFAPQAAYRPPENPTPAPPPVVIVRRRRKIDPAALVRADDDGGGGGG
jgi:hypothetical protein